MAEALKGHVKAVNKDGSVTYETADQQGRLVTRSFPKDSPIVNAMVTAGNLEKGDNFEFSMNPKTTEVTLNNTTKGMVGHAKTNGSVEMNAAPKAQAYRPPHDPIGQRNGAETLYADKPFVLSGKNASVEFNKDGTVEITATPNRPGAHPETISFHNPLQDKNGKTVLDAHGQPKEHPLMALARKMDENQKFLDKPVDVDIAFDGKGNPADGHGHFDYHLQSHDHKIDLRSEKPHQAHAQPAHTPQTAHAAPARPHAAPHHAGPVEITHQHGNGPTTKVGPGIPLSGTVDKVFEDHGVTKVVYHDAKGHPHTIGLLDTTVGSDGSRAANPLAELAHGHLNPGEKFTLSFDKRGGFELNNKTRDEAVRSTPDHGVTITPHASQQHHHAGRAM